MSPDATRRPHPTARPVTSALADYDYSLPDELIAQVPCASRSDSRLLHVEAGRLVDRRFRDLPDLIERDDVVVVNDTRVVRARLAGRKPSGGRVELLIERVVGETEAWALVRASHPPREGGAIELPGGARATVVRRDGALSLLAFTDTGPLPGWLVAHGRLPLPPYIARPDGPLDDERYQTVYAMAPGAVAAPTAGLHFDTALLAEIEARGASLVPLTLHVGAGTFRPVRDDDIAGHRMHAERYTVPESTVTAIAAARSRGGRVLAVGTTTLRALESAATGGTLVPTDGETELFIRPGYRFRVVDRLLTNFHLPRSTLLMLVYAYGGTERLRRAYAHAIADRYRFFSYGDAMLLEPDTSARG